MNPYALSIALQYGYFEQPESLVRGGLD